jgi:hypothetical protein
MESIFLDTCEITRPGEGDPVFDEETGQYTYPDPVVVYTGPCRLQVKVDINSNVVETTAGEREWTYLTATLQLPYVGSEDIRPDNVAKILTSAHDDTLPGRLYNVQGIYHKSDATHRRYRVREVIS